MAGQRLLLDTHVILWWLADSPRLSRSTRAAIADPRAKVLVSAAAIWEMAIKQGIGRLDFPPGLLDVISQQGIDLLPVTGEHALAVMTLPPIHRDPFDRLQVAQAREEELVLVTADADIPRYDVTWMPA